MPIPAVIRKTIKPVKILSLEDNYIKKTEKAKKGGKGTGAVYRNNRSGKDYMIKRVLNAPQSENWRSWDEILAARLLKAVGVLVPNMFAVKDSLGFIHVASAYMHGVTNCKSPDLKTLPPSSVDAVMVSQLIHCWLGNRDLVNVKGENYVVDKDSRIFNVDLGATLFSGFRSAVGNNQDEINYNAVDFSSFLVANDNKDLGMIIKPDSTSEPARNVGQIKQFFSKLLGDEANQRKYHLQGGLLLQRKMDDKMIKHIVNSTDHTQEDKQKRIGVLKGRRKKILEYLKEQYGEYALCEERLELELQYYFHKQGCFNPPPKFGGSDAGVSFCSQYQNAIKPQVRIKDGDQVIITIYHNQNVTLQKISYVFGQILNESVIYIQSHASHIEVRLSLYLLQENLHRAVIANAFRVFYSSYNYLSDERARWVYKGDGSDGFLPTVNQNPDNSICLSYPLYADPYKLKSQIITAFDLNQDNLAVQSGFILIKDITLEEFAYHMTQNTGIRKTAIISENEHGEILAGKLLKANKGVSGFATAGGNSDYPYNPERAARDEGRDEFGYNINDDIKLIPIGSTLPNKKKNIFLVQAGGTSVTQDHNIPYAEFDSKTIRYYSFKNFVEAYRKDNSQFDRSSMTHYLLYYQREIQIFLCKHGIKNIIVHISKKPNSLGEIVFKASLDGNQSIKNLNLSQLNPFLDKYNFKFGTHCTLTTINSPQGSRVIKRQAVKFNENISPSCFLRILKGEINHELNDVSYDSSSRQNQIVSWKLQALLGVTLAIVTVLAFALAMLAVHVVVIGHPLVTIEFGSLLIRTTPLILGTISGAVCLVSGGSSFALVRGSLFSPIKHQAHVGVTCMDSSTLTP